MDTKPESTCRGLRAAAWTAALLAAGLVAMPAAQALGVVYELDQSNINRMPDGVPRLLVTITENVNGNIDFRVETIAGAFNEGRHFGIQGFGFNLGSGASGLDDDNFLLPDDWDVDSRRRMDGFGRFDVVLTGDDRNDRQDPLEFSIIGIVGDTAATYFDLSSRFAAQGNQAFAAHVAGFELFNGWMKYSGHKHEHGHRTSSGYFAGSTPVPLPGAVWLLGSGLVALGAFLRRRRSTAAA